MAPQSLPPPKTVLRWWLGRPVQGFSIDYRKGSFHSARAKRPGGHLLKTIPNQNLTFETLLPNREKSLDETSKHRNPADLRELACGMAGLPGIPCYPGF
jgi:hypothetical protein